VGIHGRFLEAERYRLGEQRLVVVEESLAVDLDLGLHLEVADSAARLAGQHPLREELLRLWMLALYRGGRAAQALAVYRDARKRFAEELAITPGRALEELHRAVLNHDGALMSLPASPRRAHGIRTLPGIPAPPTSPVPAQLPAPVSSFVGRRSELEQLDRAVHSGVGVTVVVGMPGVGKTTLAVQWAHQIRNEYPDGQLFASLHGTNAGMEPADPAAVLTSFLQALGVSPERIPPYLTEKAALYRTLLADKRTLIVLDSAAAADQVEPLLPGSVGSRVIVTSRRRLGGLLARHDAVSVPLDVLNDHEAAELFAHTVGRTGSDEADPDAVAQVVRLCGGLPLAVRLLAARLAARPALSLRDVVAELTDARRRLDLLAVDDTSVTRTLMLSLRTVPDRAARLLRLLALHPGPDIDVAAAAALTGTDAAAAQTDLDALAESNLLSEVEPGRYRCHDLVRDFALHTTQTEDAPDERAAAVRRLREHYLGRAEAAESLLRPSGHQQPQLSSPASFATAAEARAWLDAERANIAAVAVEHALADT
jgi:hypothetical protein